MKWLLDIFGSCIGFFLGMRLYDFLERKIDSIKGTPEDDDKETSHDSGRNR